MTFHPNNLIHNKEDSEDKTRGRGVIKKQYASGKCYKCALCECHNILSVGTI